jgi:NAD(P)-dependent dehydrogenase (short-subunit alcohol dehydrogenase family)
MEFLTDGIRANTISPGVVDTSMHANDDHEILERRHPFPQLVQISEIVDALLYLQSASMVNGENIRIDGGAPCWRQMVISVVRTGPRSGS